MDDYIIKRHFWKVGVNGDKTLKASELGWPKTLQRDAKSDYPETIFRYAIESVGFNLLFYWIKDESFYAIETEKDPIEVRKLYTDPNWNGDCEFLKIAGGPYTCSPGEIIATFESPTDIWDSLRIDGIRIGDVLEQSCIMTWD